MAADDEKKPGTGAAELLLELFKEQTQAQLENTKALRALTLQIVGVAPDEKHPDGLIGLMDRLGDIGEAIDTLDEHVVGQNVLLSRINYVFDHWVQVATGDPTATPPVEPRTPTLQDTADALLAFDKELEEEALRQAEAEKEEEAANAPPAKPSMLSNGPAKAHPRLKALPPLPVSAPLPQSK